MKLLRNFAVFGICAALLCGCTPDPDIDKGPEPTIDAKEALLTLEEYPRMDGSTANLPLMAEVLSRTTGITKEEAENAIRDKFDKGLFVPSKIVFLDDEVYIL